MADVVKIKSPVAGKIVSDVPIPEMPGGRNSLYPFSRMRVGDSFFWGDPKARMAAGAYKGRHPGWDYTTRAESGGVRIWRTR